MALALGLMATAQVKIGANPTTIDANSILELETINQGLLFPRVELVSTDSYLPLNDTFPNVKQKGMTVYNTATTTSGLNDVTEGLYTNDGTDWVKVGGATPKTLYTDNGTLTGSRTVTLDNNDLTFTSDGTGKTVVDSAFKTSGAVYGKVVNIGAALTYTVLSDDYMIVSEATSTITLPAANENAGRIIIVVNNKPAAGTVTVLGDVKWLGVMTLTQYKGKQYFSDGTRWYSVTYN